MSFMRRPDSFLVISGREPANRTGNTATGVDSLSEFVSEAEPPATAAPTVFVSEVQPPAIVRSRGRCFGGTRCCQSRQRRHDVGQAAPTVTSETHRPGCLVWTTTNARRRRRDLHRNRGRLRRRRHHHPLGGSDRPSTNVPPTNASVAPKVPPPSPLVPALPPDPRWAVNPVTPDPPPQASPVVATTNRAVGTTGRRTAESNQATKTSRAATTSYRGSLAIRSAPKGARVFLNGALVGSTPLELEQPAGRVTRRAH